TQDPVNGQRLGAPAQRSARFLFYNQTWARELGFSAPPATADEFRQQ
ncbi:MAG: ABC transporter substrate-binding protein, partial [Chloroflexi bacterium CG_4_10_14_0_8_um_filter_57_5]